MKFRVIGILAVVVMIALVLTGVAFSDTTGRITRYHQHEQSRSLSGLNGADRKAASSAAIDAEHFTSHLPVVSIATGGQDLPGRPIYENGEHVFDEQGTAQDVLAADGMPTIAVEFSLYNNGGSNDDTINRNANRLSDKPEFTTHAEMRIRGHSSSSFEKPSYRVTFTQEDRVTTNPQDVLSMGVEEDWVLHGPYLDKSLMRNYIALNIFGELLPFTPDVRFVELFIDDTYQGLYVFMETIKHDVNRVNIQTADPNSTETSFLVTRDWFDNMDANQLRDFIDLTYRTTSTGTEIAYPNELTLTGAQREWIEDYLNEVEKVLYSYDYDTPDFGYWKHLDTDSFVDYVLVNEISLNEDAGKFSTWLYQDLGGKLKAGPPWDFNNAFDNGFEQSVLNTNFVMLGKPLFSMLFRDEQFTEKIIRRYRELREGLLADDRILDYVDSVVEYLGPAVERNYAVWGYTLDPEIVPALDSDQRLTPVYRNPASFEEAIGDLKGALTTRMKWLDEHIETLRQYSHESAVKEYNH